MPEKKGVRRSFSLPESTLFKTGPTPQSKWVEKTHPLSPSRTAADSAGFRELIQQASVRAGTQGSFPFKNCFSALDIFPARKYTLYTPHPRGVLFETSYILEGCAVMADQKAVLRLLKTARGQMDGIIKMVEEDRYCIDISTQVMAAEAMLNRANKEILTAHLKHCVNTAQTQEEREKKIDELVDMLGKILK